jgi:hypothetical protein
VCSATDEAVDQQGLQVPPSIQHGDNENAILLDAVKDTPGALDRFPVLVHIQGQELGDLAPPLGICFQGRSSRFESLEYSERVLEAALGNVVDDTLQIPLSLSSNACCTASRNCL